MKTRAGETGVNLFDDLFAIVPRHPDRHAVTDDWWQRWDSVVRSEIEYAFREGAAPAPFGPFGLLSFPYVEMGAINSLDLFGFDELLMFAFYNANRATYKRVVDFGANIGLHSIIMAKCGFEVRSFEPDPRHLVLLKDNLARNGVTAEIHEAAISIADGETTFVRVQGNTTGSHIKGAKPAVYGGADEFKVRVAAAQAHLAWADLAKIDIEGHEAELLTRLPLDIWQGTDAFVEVGSLDNALKIFDYFKPSPVNLFAQKTGWRKVAKAADMPESHREGSLFISAKPKMPWPR